MSYPAHRMTDRQQWLHNCTLAE